MASVPPPSACLKCATPLVPGSGFCGTCGTPAGSTGTAPLPPPMPPRPMGMGAHPVVMPMDAGQAMQAATLALQSVKGEITNQGPNQIAFRVGSQMSGRHTGMIEALPEGPQRTTLNLSLKADYGSLLPVAGITLVMWIGFYFMQQQQLNNPANYTMYGYQGMYLSPGLMFFIIAGCLGGGAYLLGTSTLEKRRKALVAALQGQGAIPPMPAAAPQPYPGQPVPGAGPVPPRPDPAAAPATPFEQLSRLAELRDKGAITAADYDQAKASIMAKIG